MDSASAVFIFANKFAANTDGEDSRTILRALSIKRWVVGPPSATLALRAALLSDHDPLAFPIHGLFLQLRALLPPPPHPPHWYTGTSSNARAET